MSIITSGELSMNIILAAALLPAIILMVYVYSQDKVEKEPLGLLVALFGYGAISCIPASILEQLFTGVLDNFDITDKTTYYLILCFGIIAVAEEGSKLYFLKRKTWKNPEFNHTFDGLVYAVFVGLGFAGLENIMYVMNYGFGVVVSRGLLAIPGHCTFAVFMGLFYSRAKLYDRYGYQGRSKLSMIFAFLVSLLLHGFYDFCLMMSNEHLTMVFFGFVIIVDIASLFIIKQQSKSDYYI